VAKGKYRVSELIYDDDLKLPYTSGAPYDLGDLDDVTITGVADNELLAYDSGSSKWINQTAAEAGISSSEITWETTTLVDEFIFGADEVGELGELGWYYSGDGTATMLSGVSDHPGIVRLTTGATAANAMTLSPSDSSTYNQIDWGDIDKVAFIVRVPTVTTVVVAVGFETAANGYAAIMLNSAAAADWYAYSDDGGTTESTDTDVTATAGNWFLLEIENATSSVKFYINNTLEATHSTRLPSGAGFITINVTTLDNVARTFDIDWFRLVTADMGNRWT